MRYFILSACVLFLSVQAVQAQTGDTKKNELVPYASKCSKRIKYCNDCGEKKANWKNEKKLTQYFEKNLDMSKLANVYGSINVKVLVDSEGNVCCKEILNNTFNSAKSIAALNIGDAVNEMPKWDAAYTHGKGLNSLVTLTICSHMKDKPTFWVEYAHVEEKKK
ncbi:MAG: hypothetical protein JSS96_06350 [Bacteroidetes bacterium]|nr:hypothetical protein [Bacteroidota bacterium]